ncbi:hypothetical protein EOD39_16880 [Acipenser ruthenus]|uniref:Uncharacterized protein n=1 Tax=Acipenser ruthenus TaxID=7906 RepID=A0A444V4T9_ACIRT|nr:hypothetical protein EOD39_16880 [Acipenser ruthenus]
MKEESATEGESCEKSDVCNADRERQDKARDEGAVVLELVPISEIWRKYKDNEDKVRQGQEKEKGGAKPKGGSIPQTKSKAPGNKPRLDPANTVKCLKMINKWHAIVSSGSVQRSQRPLSKTEDTASGIRAQEAVAMPWDDVEVEEDLFEGRKYSKRQLMDSIRRVVLKQMSRQHCQDTGERDEGYVILDLTPITETVRFEPPRPESPNTDPLQLTHSETQTELEKASIVTADPEPEDQTQQNDPTTEMEIQTLLQPRSPDPRVNEVNEPGMTDSVLSELCTDPLPLSALPGNTAVVQEVQKFVASATGEGLDEFNMVASQGQASSGSTPGSVQDSLFHMALALLGALLFVLPVISWDQGTEVYSFGEFGLHALQRARQPLPHGARPPRSAAFFFTRDLMVELVQLLNETGLLHYICFLCATG